MSDSRPSRRPPRSRGVIAGARLTLALALASVLATACGDDAADESPGTTTPTTDASPTTTVDEETAKEEAATAAYLAYWEAYIEATSDPVDPHSPALQELMTGDHQRVVTRNLSDRQARGEAVKWPPGSQAKHEILTSELQEDGSVFITECEIDDSIVYVVHTRDVVNGDVATKLATAVMIQVGDRWRLSESEVIDRWPGAVECVS